MAQNIAALWIGTQAQGEADASVTFFTARFGAVRLSARGLLKSGSKLAGRLASGDELLLATAAGRGASARDDGPGSVLTGVETALSHADWRADMDRLALLWWLLQAAQFSSAAAEQSADVYRLLVNALRSAPDAQALPALAVVCSMRLLGLLGFLPALPASPGAGLLDVHGHSFEPAQPGREGLIADYQPPGGVAIGAQRMQRYRQAQSAPLLDYPRCLLDIWDAELWCALLSRSVEHNAGQRLDAFTFLRRQWKMRAAELSALSAGHG